MMNWSGGMGGAGWVLMSVLWVILLAAIGWALTVLYRRGDRPAGASGERPEDILDRRLASGELDATSYDELRSKLQSAARR